MTHRFHLIVTVPYCVVLCLGLASPAAAQSADQREVIHATEKLFDAMRARDAAALRALLHADARVISIRATGEVAVRTGEEWVKTIAASTVVPDERMRDPEVRVDGHLATLWAPYTFHRGDKFSHCGIDAFQYVRSEGAWRLISVVFTSRTTGCEGMQQGLAGSPPVPAPARPWPGVDPSRLSTIYVLDDAGVETTGQLLRFDPDAVVIVVDGAERRIESKRVKRIQRRGDSLKNGAIAGALVGGILGGLSAGVADCPGADSGCPAFRIFAPILSAAFYAAVGTGIDALVQGRTTLYVAADPPTSGAASLLRNRPGLRTGISLRFSW